MGVAVTLLVIGGLIILWAVGVVLILLVLRRSYRRDERAIIDHEFQQITEED